MPDARSPRKLKKPVEVLRKELLEDKDTQRIATAIGVPLEQYVELVLDYAQHPEKKPQLDIAPDEELRAMGYEPPTGAEVGQFLVDTAQNMGPLRNARSNFKAEEKAPLSLGQQQPMKDEDLPEGNEDLKKLLVGRKGGSV